MDMLSCHVNLVPGSLLEEDVGLTVNKPRDSLQYLLVAGIV